MPPPSRPLHVQAGLPFDESSQNELTDVGTQNASNTNVRMYELGTLGKRLGYAPLTTAILGGGNIGAGLRMFSSHGQLCVIDGTNLYTYSPTLNLWVNKGRVPEATYQRIATPTVGDPSSTGEDSVLVNGLLVIVYAAKASDSSVTFCTASVIDPANGEVIRLPESLGSTTGIGANGSGWRLASYGNYAIAFLASTTTITLKYLDLTSAASLNAGWHALATVSDYLNGSNFDVASCLSNDRVALAYINQAGATSRITAKTYTIAGQIDTVNVSTSSVVPTFLGLAENADTLWIAWKDATANAVKAIGLNPVSISGAALATAFTVFSSTNSDATIHVVPRSAAGTAAVYATGFDASGHWIVLLSGIKTSGGAGAVDGSLNKLGGSLVLSKPFLRGGLVYAHLCSSAGTEAILCDVTPDTVSGSPAITARPVCASTVRGIGTGSTGAKSRTNVWGSTTYLYLGNVIGEQSTTPAALWKYDFADPLRWRPASVGNATYVGGGILSVFDGARVSESGFLVAPSKPIATQSGAGSLTLANGRSYVAVYEDVDANGNIHISGVSLPSAPIGASTHPINVTVSPLSITNRLGGNGAGTHAVNIALYATLDSAVGAAPYYRMATLRNDPTVAEGTIVDLYTDAVLSTQSLLYGTGNLPGTAVSTASGTTSASQDHRAPPGLVNVASYNGMLCGLSEEVIYFSSQSIPGEGQWFSPVFVQLIDERGTGLFVQDGTLFPFTRTGIWATSGDPPSDNLSVGGLGTPRKLAINCGCTNANSIVSTEIGTIFQTDIGLELFTRGQATEFIGKGVQTTLQAYPVVTAATLDTKSGLAIFALTSSQTNGVAATNGIDVVFDLVRAKGWISRDDKRGTVTTQSAQDSCVALIGGVWRYAWLGTDGTVYYQKLATDSDKCLDGASFVTSTWELPPMKLGLQQEQRVYESTVFAERKSAAGLKIEMAVDFGTYGAPLTDAVWTEADTLTTSHFPFAPHARGMAVQCRVSDTAPAVLGTGEGLQFIGISTDIAPIQGPTRGTPRLAPGLRR